MTQTKLQTPKPSKAQKKPRRRRKLNGRASHHSHLRDPRPVSPRPAERSEAPQPSLAAHSKFFDFKLGPALESAIAAAGYIDPRPIQLETIGPALCGRDILGMAQTGTGKTAAFVLPILKRVLTERTVGPQALVIAPTRELARQIDEAFQQFARWMHFRSVVIFGGVSQRVQMRALRLRPDVIVACPGRLLDLIKQGHIETAGIRTLVIDEADQLFDMGFLPDVRRILTALPTRRQNMFFSATMPSAVRTLADDLLSNPHVVSLSTKAPVETIDHALYPVRDEEKFELLQSLLSAADLSSAIVFSRTKYRAKRLAERLNRKGHRAVALQGNMSQVKRDRAMAGFRNREFTVLVATDIAARGIDVARVSHVINYDVPQTPEAYTHRIGRTGRAQQSGVACTLVTSADRKLVLAIESRIGGRIPRRNADGSKLHQPSRLPKSRERSRHRPGGGYHIADAR